MILVEELVKEFRVPPPPSQVARLRFKGRTVRALDGISFRLEDGEIVGLMGINGAGKSTLLRLLGGLLSPTSGRVEAAGLTGPSLRRRVGYVFSDERSFSMRLTVRENLAFFGALHGLSRREALSRTDGLLERVGLSGQGLREFRELSSGMRQRAAIARGLLGDPRVLLFDEPTRAVDPAGAESLRALIAESAVGRTVLLATHLPSEAERLCARVLLLDRGRLAGAVSPAEASRRLEASGG